MDDGLYAVKRRLRLPLIWWGRWRHRGDSPQAIARLERHGYRRGAVKSANAVGFDPQHYYRTDLDASSTVIDIGGFTGEVAETIFSLYGCRIHAFEPNPNLYPELEARFVDNPQVTTYPFGLGGQDATLSMQLIGLGSTVYGESDPDAPAADVPIRDVSAVLDELAIESVDFMKINIEGGEFELIPRLIDTGWTTRTRYLLIQFHEWLPHAHWQRWMIRRRLRKTHEQVWNYPWIYELWCAKDNPPPRWPKFSEEDLQKIKAEWIAQRDAETSA